MSGTIFGVFPPENCPNVKLAVSAGGVSLDTNCCKAVHMLIPTFIGSIPKCGISDSIPIKKSIADGNKKNIVILTRDNTYRKNKNSLMPVMKLKYKKYPNFVKSMADRHIVYNETLDFIKELEKNGDVFVIRPKKPVTIGRTEKNREKLEALYNDGYNDAKDCYEELLKYLGKENL